MRKPKKPKKTNLREKSEAQAQAIVRACFWFPGARAALEGKCRRRKMIRRRRRRRRRSEGRGSGEERQGNEEE